ncbi:hypothetical protein CRUP_035075, partial [Coryphaenoides rupestris]
TTQREAQLLLQEAQPLPQEAQLLLQEAHFLLPLLQAGLEPLHTGLLHAQLHLEGLQLEHLAVSQRLGGPVSVPQVGQLRRGALQLRADNRQLLQLLLVGQLRRGALQLRADNRQLLQLLLVILNLSGWSRGDGGRANGLRG